MDRDSDSRSILFSKRSKESCSSQVNLFSAAFSGLGAGVQVSISTSLEHSMCTRAPVPIVLSNVIIQTLFRHGSGLIVMW